MKKSSVEIYFVIYLGAIISFLAIEGELDRYKDNQKHILQEVAKEKAVSLVEVQRKDDSSPDSVNLRFNIEGDFKFVDKDARVKFISDNDIVESSLLKGNSVEFPYFVKLSKKKGETLFNNPDNLYDVLLSFKIVPAISERTRQKWARDYGELIIADRLIDIISDMKTIKIERNIAYAIKPTPGGLPDIELNGFRPNFTAIKGVEWTNKIIVSPAKSNSDYDISIRRGKATIKNKNIGTVEIAGTSFFDESITIFAEHNITGTKDAYTFNVSVINPRWEFDPPGPSKVCVGEDFELDLSIRGVSSDRISYTTKLGSNARSEIINSSIAKYIGKNVPVMILTEVFIDNSTQSVLSFKTEVTRPDTPSVKLTDRNGNTLVFKAIAYCTGNKIIRFRKAYGIKSYDLMKEDNEYGNNVSYYAVTMMKPDEGKTQQLIEFIIRDSNNQSFKHSQRYTYKFE